MPDLAFQEVMVFCSQPEGNILSSHLLSLVSVTKGLLTPLYGGVSELGIESCLLGTAYVLSPLISLKLFSLNTGVDDSPGSYKKEENVVYRLNKCCCLPFSLN